MGGMAWLKNLEYARAEMEAVPGDKGKRCHILGGPPSLRIPRPWQILLINLVSNLPRTCKTPRIKILSHKACNVIPQVTTVRKTA
jgi:hypothetical protein